MERPCKVNGEEAIFHGFFSRATVIESSPMVGGHPGGTIAYPVAVVEFKDGKVKTSEVGSIVFLDSGKRFSQLIE